MLLFPKVLAGVLAIGTALAMCNGEAWAGDRGSPEDQLACTPDVYRFCSSFVPDEDAIVACLNRNLNGLSPACHKVMARPASPAQNGQPSNDDD